MHLYIPESIYDTLVLGQRSLWSQDKKENTVQLPGVTSSFGAYQLIFLK